jgi:hypothetical protein
VNGNCGLREALLAANGDSAVDACVAGSGADVVVVPAGTYVLTLVGPGEDVAASGDLDVTADLEIAGAGDATTIIDGGAIGDRVLDVDPAGAGLTVHVSGLTIRNGHEVNGGGVRSRGQLTVSDSVVEDSGATLSGAGIASTSGVLRLERSTVRGNRTYSGFALVVARGGGVSAIDLEVVDSTITGNVVQTDGPNGSAADGGGIAAGTLTMSGSTVDHNQAIRSMFVGPVPGVGGGVFIGGGTIRNSTISGNGALFGGGIAAGISTTLSLFNTTVTANSPDGYLNALAGMTLVLRNTIIAGNGVDCSDFSGSGFTTVGDAYNIDGDGSCGLSGTDQSGVNPMLGPLEDNGGPTFTHALIVGSPAIDMGSPAVPGSGGTACEATDQRGVARPVGTRCDVGAFEGSVTTTSTSTSSTTTTTLCGPVPRAGCQPALGQKAALQVKDSPDDGKDVLSWRWKSSAAVAVADFGLPATSADDYSICLYDAGGRRLAARAPGAGACPGTKPCWQGTSTGFLYRDKALDPDGLQKITLKAGAAAGKGKITVKGKGTNLPLPTLPLVTPVEVQLVHVSSPTCWTATFSTSSRNDTGLFKAKSDP